MTPGPAEKWVSERDLAKAQAEALCLANEALARAGEHVAYAEIVLSHFYLIRDRPAPLERETSGLAARFRANQPA
jgi:hypothetical protein